MSRHPPLQPITNGAIRYGNHYALDFFERISRDAFKGTWPTLVEKFRITVKRFPDRPCFTIYSPNRVCLTFSEALSRIERTAAFLASEGVRKGDKVAVTGKNSPEWAVAFMGALFAGATVVPVDYQLKNDEIENILKASDSKYLFVDEEKYLAFDPARLGLTGRYSLSQG
jgi:long-chain acyl-CoA synthetase